MTDLHGTVVELRHRLQASLAERDELLLQQAATAEILKVINTSKGDLAPVFHAILEKAHNLCDAPGGSLQLLDGEMIRAAADRGLPEELASMLRQRHLPRNFDRLNLQAYQIPDVITVFGEAPQDPIARSLVQTAKARTMLFVPLVREGRCLGRIVALRHEVRPFTEKQIALLKNFADQAVIAIENVRSFNETKEALARQIAMSDVLKVISGSIADAKPVFEKILDICDRLIGEGNKALLLVDENAQTHIGAARGPAAAEFVRGYPRPLERTVIGLAFDAGRTLYYPEGRTGQDVPEVMRRFAKMSGQDSHVIAPMMRDGRRIGAIALAREQPGSFSDNDISLLQILSDQAVIAIQNAQLFTEVQAKTADLTESLQQQIATSEVLKVISRSAFDLQLVFQTMAENAVRLCEAERAVIFQFDGALLRAVASHNVGPELWQFIERNPIAPGQQSISARAALYRRAVQVPDVQSDPDYAYAVRDVDPIRAIVSVPMLRDHQLVGTITIYKLEAKPFTDKQIALVKTFADQAVIAIQNARLFNDLKRRTGELEEALEQQTATSEILRAISQSPTDVQPVLDAVVKAAVRFCGAEDATIVLRDGDSLFSVAHEGPITYNVSERRTLDRSTAGGRAIVDVRTCHLPDTEALDLAEFAGARKLAEQHGFRAVAAAPLLREDAAIGSIVLRKVQAGPFTPQQIELLATFAAQAVIAIENVRLFTELRESLERLKAAQANLIQSEKMASLGQLTAGIAHEIKNPLNFVNNFAGLSVELLSELKEIAQPVLAGMGDDIRTDFAETMEMITSNLDKVTEHGKRADGIVKSMLSHSRGGTGDWQESNINALVEEALNLAYHGARAQDNEFNVTLERDFSPETKPIELVPQDVTRVFLNLFGNGFYAANKRRLGDAGYRPILKVSTRDLSDAVEIRVRDNGTGIPPEVRAKLFQPFFTTKPTGEGTGLGLSISYDIVTQQHGGTIEVESEPGSFTEFTVRLPRRRWATPSGGER